MKINNVKINGFGNLKDKEINLQDNINIIKGKNESGKSTFLKFIGAILYGTNRNKNGKDISDFERYKPWAHQEYSGKMTYSLNSGDTFEIFREFTKKSPKIYNEDKEDITQNYGFDKNKNSEFFIEQTGISEEIMFKTAVIEQQEVALDKTGQHILLQKIANKVSTGDDNISFSRAIKKLNDKYNEEVGTDRTVAKPLNVVQKEILTVEENLKNINSTKELIKNFDDEKEDLNKQINRVDAELKLLKEIKQLKEDIVLEEEKINIKKSSLSENIGKLREIENKERKLKTSKATSKGNIFLILFIICIICALILKIFVQNIWPTIGSLSLSIALLAIHIHKWIEKSKTLKQKQQEKLGISKEREIIEQNISERKNEITKAEEALENKVKEKEVAIKNQYEQNVETCQIDKWLTKGRKEVLQGIEEIENKSNVLRLKKSSLSLDMANGKKQLDNLAVLQESLQRLREQEAEILSTGKSIDLAKKALEEAYEKMKENITPEFTNSLSDVISTISEGKYKNIKFSDEQGLVVELENGDYINAERLSVGTIDQMYLGLRLSVLNEICKESMPLILDESFAFYDENRLKNALDFLSKEYKNNQIIILSCSNREENALKDLKIEFNLIEL